MALLTPAIFRSARPCRVTFMPAGQRAMGKVNFLLVQRARERDGRKASVGRSVSRPRPRKAAVREGMTPAEEQRAQAPHHYRYQRSSGWRTGAPSRHLGSRRRWLDPLPLPMAAPSLWPSRGQALADGAYARATSWGQRLLGAGSGRWSSDPTRPKVFKYCPGDGSSSGPSPGLAAIAG